MSSSFVLAPCSELPILLIDDDESFRIALAANLRDDGHQVHEYSAPHEVPTVASLKTGTLVITDLQMPGVSGLSFAETFHAAHPTVPIVLITAYGPSSLVFCTRDFLHVRRKPFDYEDLHGLLHQLAVSPTPQEL